MTVSATAQVRANALPNRLLMVKGLMRIALFGKRQYMRKDVLDDRYGRLHDLPWHLAVRGHAVLGLCLSYRPRNQGLIRRELDGALTWHSFNLTRPDRYLRRTLALLRDFQPDLLLGCSDSPHIILTAALANWLRLPCVADLYDNFESFGLTRLPGIRSLYRRALHRAAAISCVSQTLVRHIQSTCQPTGPVIALESTIAPGQFQPLNRVVCRQQLGLPLNARLIGTAGALDHNRGIDTLYQAFNSLAERDPNLHLVLAGSARADSPIPTHPRILYLGELPHDHMPTLFNALDIAIICIRDTAFGRYSFPQKAYEMLACGVPLIAAAVGSVGDLLREDRYSLYRPDDAQDLAEKIIGQLAQLRTPDLMIPTWADQAEKLERLLQRIILAE